MGAMLPEGLTLAHLAAFNLAILGALVSPGPAFLVLVRSSATAGRAAGLRTAIGFATGAVVWTILALGGLTALFVLVPWVYTAIKLVGVAYLVWLAFSLWRGASVAAQNALPPRRLRGFTLGLVTNLSNPKAVMFIAAIFATIFPAEMSTSAKLVIIANHFLLETTFYILATLMFTTAPVRAAYMRAKAWLDRIAAVALGLLAARMAL